MSDRGHFGKTQIDCQEYGHDALGYVVEVNPFGRSLHQQLTRTDVSLFCPDTVAKLEYQSDFANITLNSGEQLSAKLVVIADGAHSQSRKR